MSHRVASAPFGAEAGTSHRSEAGVERGRDGLGLVPSGHEEPHLAGALEALEGEANPVGRRLRGVVHGHGDGVRDALRRVVREERCDVAVRAHAEDARRPEARLSVLLDRRSVGRGTASALSDVIRSRPPGGPWPGRGPAR